MKERSLSILKKKKRYTRSLILAIAIILIGTVCTFTEASATINSRTNPASKEIGLTKKLQSCLPASSKIINTYSDDFNKDNRNEMFAIINTGKKNDTNTTLLQLWYVDKTKVKMLLEGDIYSDSKKIWDLGSQKLICFEEGYGENGSRSHVWSVKSKLPYELQNAGQSLEYIGKAQFLTYPSSYDLLKDGTGHTWKPYYLYFDKTKGAFKEYGGISISRQELLRLKGASEILALIDGKGYKINSMFYRENKIININYCDSKYNLNATLSVQNGTVSMLDLDSLETPNYDQGGIYQAAIFKDIATYPKKF